MTILTKGHDCKFCLVDGAGKLPAYDEEIVAYLIKKQSLGKVISLIPGTIKKVAHSPELFARWHCEFGSNYARDYDVVQFEHEEPAIMFALKFGAL